MIGPSSYFDGLLEQFYACLTGSVGEALIGLPLPCSNPNHYRMFLFRRHFSTVIKPASAAAKNADAYFSLINHISNIVRHDHFLERTLSKLKPSLSPLINSSNSSFVLRVLNACSSHPVPALRFFSWARSSFSSSSHGYSPSAQEFHSLLLSLSCHNLHSSMWSLLEQMRSLNLSLDSDVMSTVIHTYGKAGHPDLAVEVFNKSPNFGCVQDAKMYESLLFALVENGNFQGGYKLVRRMVRKKVEIRKETYKILVNGWCRAGKLREAQQFLDEMGKMGFSPPCRGRDLLIDGLVSAGYLEAAKGMVRKMAKEGVLPDVDTFNALVEALCKNEEVGFCVEVLREAVELGFSPDIETYKVMIPAVSKAGMFDDAFRLFHSCVDDGHKPFPSLYAAIIKGLFKAGRFGDAFSFFGDMKEKGHPPNRPVYTMMVKMCVRGGKFVEAANYLVEMMEMGLVPRGQSFDMVVEGLKHCGKYDIAKRMQQMEVSIRGN